MKDFKTLAEEFSLQFNQSHFPDHPATLYDPNRYFLQLSGKRIRPVLCLMGNELVDEITADAWQAGFAIELFHNFTLIHDDIIDKAPLRRGKETLHQKYGQNTAILAGDVMLIKAYECLATISNTYIKPAQQLFNTTAREVCEGQQMDIDFETRDNVSMEEYLHMIGLKTSVLLAASLKMGAMLGGSGERNLNLLFDFGKKLGLAFQVQDDYLDAFGDPEKFGKQPGGDILLNKKTFLLIHALEQATAGEKEELLSLMAGSEKTKVEKVLTFFRKAKVDRWALDLKNKLLAEALSSLGDVAVVSRRKKPLEDLAHYLIQRDF